MCRVKESVELFAVPPNADIEPRPEDGDDPVERPDGNA